MGRDLHQSTSIAVKAASVEAEDQQGVHMQLFFPGLERAQGSLYSSLFPPDPSNSTHSATSPLQAMT